MACTGVSTPTASPPDARTHPADDLFSMSDVAVVGTHNSYHVQTTELEAWNYTHVPLDSQMRLGVRQYELDLWWDDADGWRVFHIPALDEGTTCETLRDCLDALVVGSDALGRQHLPTVILLEIKERFDHTAAPDRMAALESTVGSSLAGHLLAPADFGGTLADLGGAFDDGWPVLTGQRGRFIPVVHARGDWAEAARVSNAPELFLDGYGDLDAPWAAVHSINDPGDPRIAEVRAVGHLVRTRADADVVEATANDPTRRDAALSSGAHFISTDFPEPHPETGYVVRVSELGPAACGPDAPTDCEDLLLEDPAITGAN